jgi:oligopeptide/dipeptide ABC transporter ATP-binding protein
MTIGETISEALKIHKIVPKNKRKERVAELLKLVGLSPGGMNLYPHEFSGGQRQRIGIARALAVNPSFIVADEPVSALDVSIQAQIINLMMELQEKLNIAYLFIAHDLSVVKHIADRVAVMYLGKIVEEGATHHLFNTPLHPYTKSLLSAVPVPDPSLRERRRHLLRGDVPNPANPPDGCRFHPRCPSSVRRCEIEEPPLREVEPQRSVACHLI